MRNVEGKKITEQITIQNTKKNIGKVRPTRIGLPNVISKSSKRVNILIL